MNSQESVLQRKSAETSFKFEPPAKKSFGMILCALALALLVNPLAHAQVQWPQFGQNNSNTSGNHLESAISPTTVANLKMKWKFTTKGDVSARPAVVDGVVYFPDWGGYLWAVNASTGKEIWGKKLGSYVTDPATGKPFTKLVYARATPAYWDGTIYIGLHAAKGYFLAIEASSGKLLWKKQVETLDPEANITASASVANGVVYVGTASDQEGQPGGGAKTARGSLSALEASTGKVLWKTYMAPTGYSGAAIWGSNPVVSPSLGLVFVGTGDNYAAPTDPEYLSCIHDGGVAAECQSAENHADSIVALSISSGSVKWAQRMEDWPENADQDGSDFWNLACPDHVAGCPTPEGPDYDFGSAPNLITYAGSKTILGAGQKSGLYYAFNPETGELLWQTQVGPGSSLSGIMWGSATDGERIYVPISDVAGIRYAGGTAGSWAALDPANGKILWQVPDPYGAWGIGPVAVANGVVYVPSTAGKATDRNMIALNAANGDTLWSFASGATTIAGASVLDGVVYWGTGYTHIPLPEFTGGVDAFYAFSINGK